MSGFQYLAVLDQFGPHVTPMAGIRLGGRYWSTTSASAAKVRALRSDDRAAILEVDGDWWSLTVGTTTILDVRRPLAAVDDPAAAGMAGLAVARLGLTHVDQIAGYIADSQSIPTSWRPRSRVLLAVRPTGRMTSDDDDGDHTLTIATGARPLPTRRRRHRVGRAALAAVSDELRGLVESPCHCVVGLVTPSGPIVLPGRWDPAGSVVVERALLHRADATLPGRCAVTIDVSDDRRPTAKAGVMLRGDAELLVARPGIPDHGQELSVRVRRATSWAGFAVTTRQAS